MPALYWFIFGAVFTIVMIAIGIGLAVSESGRKTATMRRLGRVKAERIERPAAPVLFDAEPGAKKAWDLSDLPGIRHLKQQIESAGLDWKPEMLALGMIGLGVVGALIGSAWLVLIYRAASIAALALALGALPYLYVKRKKNVRLREFEKQFPDTLDFFARAVRAGHAFSVSLELLAAESPEPVKTEFRRVFTEHNLGASLDAALRGLLERVPLVDVRFFVSAVMLQRETGGNLSEILENLSVVIRERFRLKGHVRAASAHGRMTAGALTGIPMVLLVGLSFLSPGYLKSLTDDPHGRMMLFGSVIGQVLGYFSMKKIVNIKV